MQKNTLTLVVAIALLIGLGSGYLFGQVRFGDRDSYRMMSGGSHRMSDGSMMKNSMPMDMDDMMSDMNAALSGKTGDDFDKAFITEMIVHHEGAVSMAKLALENAKHKEIVDLAKAIITAQNKEIADMKSWQQLWYTR